PHGARAHGPSGRRAATARSRAAAPGCPRASRREAGTHASSRCGADHIRSGLHRMGPGRPRGGRGPRRRDAGSPRHRDRRHGRRHRAHRASALSLAGGARALASGRAAPHSRDKHRDDDVESPSPARLLGSAARRRGRRCQDLRGPAAPRLRASHRLRRAESPRGRARVVDHAIALAAAAGELELNVMTPLVADDLALAFELLTRALRLLRTKCVEGVRVNRARVAALVRGSLIEATALSPYLGYEVTAELVKEALASGRSFRDVVAARGLVDRASLGRLLDPNAITGPQRVDVALRRRLQATPGYRRGRAAM